MAKKPKNTPDEGKPTQTDVSKKMDHEDTITQEGKAVQRTTLVVEAPNGLYLREGPHKGHPFRAKLVNGETVNPLSIPDCVAVPGWIPVETTAGYGWVMSEFLRWTEET